MAALDVLVANARPLSEVNRLLHRARDDAEPPEMRELASHVWAAGCVYKVGVANAGNGVTRMSRMHTVIDSPIGELTLVADDGALVGLYMEQHQRRPDATTFGTRAETGFEDAVQQLGEYFAGERTTFDLDLRPEGDDFQKRVWELLRTIPYGETRSYGQLARELGDPSLAQEVGAASGRNPLCVLVPCHRVVGADGSLVGYAGGLDRKRVLLDLEEPQRTKSERLF